MYFCTHSFNKQQMGKNNQVILLTGASSGIGYDTAVALAKQGHKVYAAARRVERMEPRRERLPSPHTLPHRTPLLDDSVLPLAAAYPLVGQHRADDGETEVDVRGIL